MNSMPVTSATENKPALAAYVYCFSHAESLVLVAQTSEVLGSVEVYPHRRSGIAAIIGWVQLKEFSGTEGERNLQDITWLGPRLCRHGAIIDAVKANGAVFTLPFGTLFSSLDALDREMEVSGDLIISTLQKVDQCDEWALEGSLDRDLALEVQFAEKITNGQLTLPASPGRRHLEEKRIRREMAFDLDDCLQPHLEWTRTVLAANAKDFRYRSHAENLAFNWAFLVSCLDRDAFLQCADEVITRGAETGLSIRLTGPWPPYSFCACSPPSPD
jgi:hypothetical protein